MYIKLDQNFLQKRAVLLAVLNLRILPLHVILLNAAVMFHLPVCPTNRNWNSENGFRYL